MGYTLPRHQIREDIVLNNLDKTVRYDIHIETKEEYTELLRHLETQDKSLINVSDYKSQQERYFLIRNVRDDLASPWVLTSYSHSNFADSEEKLTCQEFIDMTSTLLSNDMIEVLDKVYYKDDIKEVLKVLTPVKE